MVLSEAVTRIVERAYFPEESETRWLEGILDAGTDAFGSHVAAQALILRLNEDATSYEFLGMVGDDALNECVVTAHSIASPENLRDLYLRGPVASAGRVLRNSTNRGARVHFESATSERGASDYVGALGVDSSGYVCVLGFLRASSRLSTDERLALSRLAGHLATGYRLRRRDAGVKPRGGESIFAPSGELLDAGENDSPQQLSELGRAALAIDRAKRHVSSEPVRALGYWRAMVDGRYTLVERTEADGRRVLVARENPPNTREIRALNETERKVVALAALSLPSKVIAYELGYSEGNVSKALSSALKKLGVRNRHELVEIHGALVGESSRERVT